MHVTYVNQLKSFLICNVVISSVNTVEAIANKRKERMILWTLDSKCLCFVIRMKNSVKIRGNNPTIFTLIKKKDLPEKEMLRAIDVCYVSLFMPLFFPEKSDPLKADLKSVPLSFPLRRVS